MFRRVLWRLCPATMAEVKAAELVNASGDSVVPNTNAENQATSYTEGENSINPQNVKFVHPVDRIGLEYQKYVHSVSQVGPWIDSKHREEVKHAVSTRKRRENNSVKPLIQPYIPMETSFRRLPKDALIPTESELRCLYPMKTDLVLTEHEATGISKGNIVHPEKAPKPLTYFMHKPPNYDPNREHPFIVVLPDFRGLESDIGDVMFHWFQRPAVYQGLVEGGYVLVCPIVNIKHSIACAVESVVAHFCDWICKTYKVEGGRCHLFGKGLGGHLAMRTCFENTNVARSIVALPGRLSVPFRMAERPYEKAMNMMGVHSLIYQPGGIFKVEYTYKWKALLESAEVKPAPRVVHFADVRDHQIYYAINPNEYWNYMAYFRNSQAVSPTMSRWEPGDG
eukprot:PhF_6_TR11330/c0_g1_i1/m.18301